MGARGAWLEHLGPIWFVPVMGMSGLALAWRQAQPLLGQSALWVAAALGAGAALGFALLLVLSAWRLWRWPQSGRIEWMHPLRYVFLAAPTASMILLATLGLALEPLLAVPRAWMDALWCLGAVLQAALTLGVLWRWQRLRAARWPGVTPGLLIPVVGNVLVPLAGVPLGHTDWAWLQWALGVALWPLVGVLVLLRLQRIGPWPARLRASVFVWVAPPSVIGLGLLQGGVSGLWPLLLWGLALVFVGLALRQLPGCFEQPFGMPMWSLSFPLAAFATLSLRLAQAGWLPEVLGLLALALVSMGVAALLRWTAWGLRRGDLLLPEPSPAGVAAPMAPRPGA